MARGMAAARADPVLRRQTELAHVGAEHLRLDPRDRRRDLEQDVSPLRGEHVGHERRSIELAVVRFVGRQAARAEPGVAPVVEITRDGAQLADHERLLASSLRAERALEQLEARARIGEPRERPRRRRDHREERLRRILVRADARVRRRELEAGLVQRRVHLRGPLQVRDAVADPARAIRPRAAPPSRAIAHRRARAACPRPMTLDSARA